MRKPTASSRRKSSSNGKRGSADACGSIRTATTADTPQRFGNGESDAGEVERSKGLFQRGERELRSWATRDSRGGG
jgi:hypothetical protein